MSKELEDTIKSYKLTVICLSVIIVMMFAIFTWVLMYKVPEIMVQAVSQALDERFDTVEIIP